MNVIRLFLFFTTKYGKEVRTQNQGADHPYHKGSAGKQQRQWFCSSEWGIESEDCSYDYPYYQRDQACFFVVYLGCYVLKPFAECVKWWEENEAEYR